MKRSWGYSGADASRRVSGSQDPEGSEARGSFFAQGNPRVNQSYILFLVLALFVFAMLSSGEIGNFLMRSNNPIDAWPNTHEPRGGLFVMVREKRPGA